ncbi:MAG: TIGR03862 family flavoprotein [Pararhodobacter sp.]|nr:TIGR03862 family flavoprotein [Pararhodobacter sp.]
MIGLPSPALVIGAGPAGLMAADTMLAAGLPVIVAEAKPSPARKLLMAGKSGLNLTKDEPFERFIARYDEAAPWLAPIIARFGPPEIMRWAQNHGQDVFTGSSGRVFPRAMKASPLLRRWLKDLAARGLDLRLRWRWAGFRGDALVFDTPQGEALLNPAVTVLALGGKSWSRLGSDGAWLPWLEKKGVKITPFAPANMGFRINWSAHMQPHFGAPVKNLRLMAGAQTSRGEIVITSKGIEGGGLYPLAKTLRCGAPLLLDLFPDHDETRLRARLAARPARESSTARLRKALRLDAARLALVLECARPLPRDPAQLAALLKALRVPLGPPAPIDEAISVAGGINRAALNDDLMLKALPGIFAAGEMLDWEAPTGGYLLTACLATGLHAGRAAARWSIAQRHGADDQPAHG